ncbi:MAG TPA: hypothetical protein VFX75_03915, partial [Nitrososphaeraceae archaeon]|nr:hypothetical protein [Nitrososphaeraceae archaeon]
RTSFFNTILISFSKPYIFYGFNYFWHFRWINGANYYSLQSYSVFASTSVSSKKPVIFQVCAKF